MDKLMREVIADKLVTVLIIMVMTAPMLVIDVNRYPHTPYLLIVIAALFIWWVSSGWIYPRRLVWIWATVEAACTAMFVVLAMQFNIVGWLLLIFWLFFWVACITINYRRCAKLGRPAH